MVYECEPNLFGIKIHKYGYFIVISEPKKSKRTK
jgi:hypothetical protein